MTHQQSFYTATVEAINNLGDIDAQAYESFLTLLAHAHTTGGSIIISGVGKTGLVGKLFTSGLKSIGCNAFFVHASEAAHGDLGALKAGDMVCIISKSGQSQEVFALLEYAHQHALATVAISMNKNTYLMRLATHPVYIPVVEEYPPVTLLPSVSNVVFVTFLEQVKVALAERISLTTENFVRTHPGGKIGRKHHLVADVVRATDALPIVKRTTPLAEALILIAEKQCGCALVCDDSHLVGIITDGDVRRFMAANQTTINATVATAEDCMHATPTTIDETTSVETALLIMAERGLSQLPVTKGTNQLHGLVHIGDLVRSTVADFDVVMGRK